MSGSKRVACSVALPAVCLLLAHAGCASIAGIEDWTPLEDAGASGTGGTGGTGGTDGGTEAAPDTGPTCEDGEVRCNGAALERCNDEQDGWSLVETCDSEGLCDASAGSCQPPACEPAGDYRCTANVLEQCNDQMTAWDTVDTCANVTLCDEENHTCIPPTCSEGQYHCDGALLELCSDDLTAWVPVETCALDTYCDAVGGQCITPLCQPGEYSCDGKKLQVCNDALDDWDLTQVCGPNETCDAIGGDCDICQQDTWQCSGAALQRCADDGQSFEDVEVCGSAALCDATEQRCGPTSCAVDGKGTSTGCGSGSSDCCAIAEVAAGVFDRSNDDTAPATVDAFRMDMYEVTVARFRAFVEAGKGTQADPPAAGDGAHPAVADSGWDAAWNTNLAAAKAELLTNLNCDSTYQTWSDTPGPDENLPMNCLTWFDAFAFCAWDGGRLPTEAEWNYAAAGGDEQRLYPWGATIDATQASYDCLGDGSAAGVCTVDDILVGGTKSTAGDGLWGHADLAGNLAEWVRDGFADPYVTPCDNCTVLDGTLRSLRGGSFDAVDTAVTTTARDSRDPTTRSARIGARCVRLK